MSELGNDNYHHLRSKYPVIEVPAKLNVPKVDSDSLGEDLRTDYLAER